MKNITKIDSNIIIGYSNFANLLSKIKFFDELSTNKLEIRIKILKKFEKASRVKLSKNIFSTLFELFKIIAIVNKIINEHSGNFSIKNNRNNSGTVVRISLPKSNA